jgi:hypothetical protein
VIGDPGKFFEQPFFGGGFFGEFPFGVGPLPVGVRRKRITREPELTAMQREWLDKRDIEEIVSLIRRVTQ